MNLSEEYVGGGNPRGVLMEKYGFLCNNSGQWSTEVIQEKNIAAGQFEIGHSRMGIILIMVNDGLLVIGSIHRVSTARHGAGRFEVIFFATSGGMIVMPSWKWAVWQAILDWQAI